VIVYAYPYSDAVTIARLASLAAKHDAPVVLPDSPSSREAAKLWNEGSVRTIANRFVCESLFFPDYGDELLKSSFGIVAANLRGRLLPGHFVRAALDLVAQRYDLTLGLWELLEDPALLEAVVKPRVDVLAKGDTI
jgi:hypothetical protein